MKKALKLLPSLLLLSLTLVTGCKSEPKYRIGVSQCSQDDWRAKMNEEIMRETLLRNDIYVEIRSADDSNEKQIDDLRYFAHNKFDIIIAAPNESEALTPIIDSIYKADIPIIIFDRRVDSDNYTVYWGPDNYQIGIAAAEYVNSIDKEAKILEIQGNLETSPATERHNGFQKYVETHAPLRLLASGMVHDWSADGAERQVDSLLRIYPQTSVIYAHNDRLAIGAANATRKAGRDDIKIIGIDASPSIGIHAVADSIIDATFMYPTEGRKLIHTAISVLEGDRARHQQDIYLPTGTAVDLSNAEILLRQYEALKVETDNIESLKNRLDLFQKQHSSQKQILLGVVIILFLSFIIIFLLLRSFWTGKQHREAIERQNQQLLRQRDKIEGQNRQLKKQHDEINDILTRLKQATQSKLTFFTNVSHDLRTPLTLIAEPVEQLVSADNLSPAQTKLMKLAQKNVKILMRLINQILDFRKYETDRLNINLSEVNIASEIRDWTEAFNEVALKRHLKFKVDIPATAAEYNIAIDVEKIERVLFNLLSNAFKFTPANGTVSVTLDKDESNVYLTVSDNGKGISQDDIQRIFERFFKSQEVNPQGSGIGLALSKAFVELHGGTIRVQSEEGKGATFTVQIPIRHITETERPSAHLPLPEADVTSELADIDDTPQMPSTVDKTILIIDDNADICTLIKALTSDRFTVIQASNGAMGIKLATKYVPDLIICDVMMPGIDGLETCRRLKSEVTTSHIPVLMLTACAMDEQRVAGYNCGADAYLTKPFSSAVLLARIDSLIENRKRLYATNKTEMSVSVRNSTTPPDSLTHGTDFKDIDSEFFNRFVEIVSRNLSNPDFNIDEIGQEMGVSRVQLYRKLKSLTNYSPTDLLRIIRLQKAATLLKTTEYTVNEVSYAVGFTSHSYFTKCYKKYFGESPSESQRRTSKL